MSRYVCLAVILGGLVASSGCSSCFGGAGCRRPSFMEFRSPCQRGSGPMAPPLVAPGYAPAAAPCGPVCEPACGPAPCCNEGGMGMGGMGGVIMEPTPAAPLGEPGTFS